MKYRNTFENAGCLLLFLLSTATHTQRINMAHSEVAIPSQNMSLTGDKSFSERASGQGLKMLTAHRPSKGECLTSASGIKGAALETREAKNNPFKVPPDSDIFLLRDKEKERKKAERLRQQSLKVHEKTTYASRINFRPVSVICPPDSESEEEEEADKVVAVKEDPQFTIAISRGRHIERESLSEYIAKKREMFLVQYSLGVKRDEMRKLEEIAQAEEKKLELAEQYLEEDAAMFDEFLKENDKNSVEAIKVAEAEAKLKIEKVNEIKKINAQMIGIKSEIAKYEDTLKEFQMYRQFLDSLIPQEIQEERQKIRDKKKEEKMKNKERERELDRMSKASSKSKKSLASSGRKHSEKVSAHSGKGRQQEDNEEKLFDPEEFADSDEEPDLYFTDPQQLLDIFSELEEQNLSLIQNSQETEEALEEMKSTIKETKLKMEKETKMLTEQIEKLQSQIHKEEAKSADLKMKAKMFNYGEFRADDDQEQHLAELNKKVEDVYRHCIGDNEANISTLQMLTNIENRLEELFEIIETMPPEKVEAAEKQKDKERRLKLREEKLEQLRLHQEERIKKALERAQAAPKKQTGKKLVFRSEPPQLEKKEDEGADLATKEEEELQYYFAW